MLHYIVNDVRSIHLRDLFIDKLNSDTETHVVSIILRFSNLILGRI